MSCGILSSMVDEKSGLIRPPSQFSGFDLRAWAATCVLANPNLVSSSDPEQAVIKALAIADALIGALKNRLPGSIEPPSEAKLERWEKDIKSKQRDTIPARRRVRRTSGDHFSEATQSLRRASAANVQAVKPPASPAPQSSSENPRDRQGFYSLRDID